MRVLKIFGVVLFSALCVFVFAFIKSCNNGFGYKAGSGLGSLVDVGGEKYKSEYLQKNADTFFTIYPEYKPLAGDRTNEMTRGYEFLNLTSIYFKHYPTETYCVQWSGTGFISVRFAYSYERNEEVLENTRDNVIVPESEKERMTKRFKTEVLARIDSIIAKSKDSIMAIYKPAF